MIYEISQQVSICPECKAKMEKVYRYGQIFLNCLDCNKLLQIINIGDADVILICTDKKGEKHER